MSSHSLKLASRTFASRIADLGFTADLPADWISHGLPAEEVDFSNPTHFVPLAVVTAPHAALVFAFAARPAYDDGDLNSWAMYLLSNNNLRPRAIGRGTVAGVAAAVGEATQDSEMGPMLVRFAFFEDGGRLINLTLSAPEMLEETVRGAWFAMLQSFLLETPRGSRFAVEDHPDLRETPPIPEPWMEKTHEVEPAREEPECAGEPVTGPAESKTRFVDFALEGDTSSLDPFTTINANLQERGAGLVPRILEVDEDDRRATVGAGAIVALIDVPYGWHVIDDGKRTLVFEPTGRIQISLNLISRDDRSDEEILNEIEAHTRRDYAAPEFMRIGGETIRGLRVRNITDGEQPLEQLHLLRSHRIESMVLRARVTATPETASDAGQLAGLVLGSCRFDLPEPENNAAQLATEPEQQLQTEDGRPAWWHAAVALEAADRLEEAEKIIRDGCPYIGFAYSTAEMYRRRMRRLMTAGDAEGALQAFKKSSEFIFFYASMATSGGEGAALSAERDEFRAQLVAEYGSDPEARCA